MECQSIQSATAHLQRIVAAYNNEAEQQDWLPPLQITAPNDAHPVDYVYVAINPSVMTVPWPHWLNDIKTILESRGLSVRWKVNSGDDCTRQIFFLTDSETHSRTLCPLIDRYLTEADIAIQGAWTSKTPNPHVVYDVVSLEHVQWLRDHPPTIDGCTYYASQYRFVQPLFAFELTAMRCREFQSARSTNYIRRRYGDVISQSRMT